jgi:hypothetical protein
MGSSSENPRISTGKLQMLQIGPSASAYRCGARGRMDKGLGHCERHFAPAHIYLKSKERYVSGADPERFVRGARSGYAVSRLYGDATI